MIQVTSSISLDESEFQVDFIRSSGPGGQNVNKVSSAAQVRWNIRTSQCISPMVKERLEKLAGNRITEDGNLLIEAKRYRTQEQNRLDAFQRIIALVQKALEVPKVRKATRPTISAKAARVADKKKRGEVKRIRKYNPDDWE
jgi:ribosome-associated protein